MGLFMCHNLPSGEGAKGLFDGPRVCLPVKENVWSRHQRLFEENVRKPKAGLRILRNKGSGVVYARASVTKGNNF